jgi:hypothetical protein
MKYRVYICKRGDVFIFDAVTGQHLYGPYRGGDDPEKPFRKLIVQDSFAITCDDLAEACFFLTHDEKHYRSSRFVTWIKQLLEARRLFEDDSDDMEHSRFVEDTRG